jgi:hypothetical protein
VKEKEKKFEKNVESFRVNENERNGKEIFRVKENDEDIGENDRVN